MNSPGGSSLATRAAAPEDAVDGVQPQRVLEPDDAGGVAAALAEATAARRSTVVRGGGTKTGWGRPPAKVDQVLSTARLHAPLIHRDGDLTATVGAGVRLADLNAHLSQKGQWLPVESAFAGTTIGGLIATNEAGPFRHRFGTPRDLLIGVTLAFPDGRLVKSGGTVVKNVAGYDLGRLVSGSLGSLAVVVDATFKLAPLAAVAVTLELRCADAAALAAAGTALSSSQLEPSAFDLRVACAAGRTPSRHLFVRFTTSPAAAATQAAALAALVPGFAEVKPAVEADLWRDQLTLPWQGAATVRCSWSPGSLGEVVQLLESSAGELAGLVLTGRAGVGAGFVRLDGHAAAQASVIQRLRQSPLFSHVVLLGAAPELKTLVDVWGDPVPWAAPLRALKQSLDPAGILGAGRGPL
jgi:glycolate oxidase FAD binding subunit